MYGQHTATKGIDSCRQTGCEYWEQHLMVIDNSMGIPVCDHTHNAWGVCEQCRYENRGIHKRENSNVAR